MKPLIIPVQNLKDQVISSKEVTHFYFDIQNPNSEAIHVVSAKTSCGCTTASYPNNIPGGGIIKVLVSINKVYQSGFTVQSVTMTFSNDQKVELTISGSIN